MKEWGMGKGRRFALLVTVVLAVGLTGGFALALSSSTPEVYVCVAASGQTASPSRTGTCQRGWERVRLATYEDAATSAKLDVRLVSNEVDLLQRDTITHTRELSCPAGFYVDDFTVIGVKDEGPGSITEEYGPEFDGGIEDPPPALVRLDADGVPIDEWAGVSRARPFVGVRATRASLVDGVVRLVDWGWDIQIGLRCYGVVSQADSAPGLRYTRIHLFGPGVTYTPCFGNPPGRSESGWAWTGGCEELADPASNPFYVSLHADMFPPGATAKLTTVLQPNGYSTCARLYDLDAAAEVPGSLACSDSDDEVQLAAEFALPNTQAPHRIVYQFRSEREWIGEEGEEEVRFGAARQAAIEVSW
jgi:hypothetical protein